MASASASFWASYDRIGQKLKKRFMRKPNYAEGAADYEELKRLMRREGQPNYAAFCCLAVARCNQVLGDTQAEAAHHAEAAALYAHAERDVQRFAFAADGSTVGFEENYAEAVDCYQLAIQQYLKMGNAVMAVDLSTELAGLVKLLAKYDEAVNFYQTAISLQTHYGIGLLQRTHSYEAVLDCLFRQRHYKRAISVLEELINLLATERTARMPSAGPHADDLLAARILEAEVTRLLLMLVENADRDAVYREFARLAGDPSLDPGYFGATSVAESPMDVGETPPMSMISGVLNTSLCISDHLADMLEAVIESSLACDIEALVALDATLSSSFTAIQRGLLGRLIETRQRLL